MERIGSQLKQLRKDMNVTMDELVEHIRLINPNCRISKSNISKWENDIEFPSTENICMLSYVFNVSADSLLGINNKTVATNIPNLKLEQLLKLRNKWLNDLKDITQNLLLCEEYIDKRIE
jgi:transcriptional regulator with XRE-family HTH domain